MSDPTVPMTTRDPNPEDAHRIIRRAVKRICSLHPCNHINCNLEWFGCVNTPAEPIAEALAQAFRVAGQSGWATAITAAVTEHKDAD